MTEMRAAAARPRLRLPSIVVLCGFLAVAGFFLWTEHRAHLLGALPYLLLLACPLMHIFGHHGHHGHRAEGGGFILLSSAWRVLHAAQQERRLVTSGAYAVVRHPQSLGFILIMLGFLLQWPTLVTLLMFPILVVMYVRLARREEGEARAQFGTMWVAYVAQVPSFLPRLGGRGEHARLVSMTDGQVQREHERPR